MFSDPWKQLDLLFSSCEDGRRQPTCESRCRFRRAACQLDTLVDCLDYDELKGTFTSLPETLFEAYDRILRGMPPKYNEKAAGILQLLAFSERPLRIEEDVDSIAVKPEGEPSLFHLEVLRPDPLEISRYWSSLVTSAKGHSLDKDNKYMELQLVRSLVKEYPTSNVLDKDTGKSFQEIAVKVSIATVCLASHLDLGLPIQKIKETFPLAQYSARYWMINATVAEGEDETVQRLIVEIFRYHECSYKTYYSLYRPDQPYHDESDIGREKPTSPLCYTSFGGFRNTVQYLLSRGTNVNTQGGRYGKALQAALYRATEKVVELVLGKVCQVPTSTIGALVFPQCESWTGFAWYKVLPLVVGAFSVLAFLVDVTGKGKKASHAVATWIGRLTYITCLSLCLIETICGDLHASHSNPSGARPVATYRSNPAQARSRLRPVNCGYSFHPLRQLVRSLTYRDREAVRRYHMLTSVPS